MSTDAWLLRRVAATVFYSLDVCINPGDMLYIWIQFVLYSKQICLQFIYHICNSSHETREGIDTWILSAERRSKGRTNGGWKEQLMNGTFMREKYIFKFWKKYFKKWAGRERIRSQVQTSADSDFRVRSPDGYPSQPSQSKHASPPRISFGRKSYAVSDVGSAKGKLSSKIRTKVDAKRNLIAFMFSQLLSRSLA